MTATLPSSLTATATANGVSKTAAASTVSAVSPVSGVASAAQVAPILAAAQAALANTVNLSPQAQQAIKADAFAQVVSQLVQQIQGGSVQLPAHWPAGGVTLQWQALLQALVQQASAGQPLPQQMLNVQSWPAALAQAVLQHAGRSSEFAGANASPPTGSSLAPAPASPSGVAQPAVPLPIPLGTIGPKAVSLQPALPPLQNWLVQQGVLQGQDGERAFTLTLRVPVAWAQAQSVLGQALGAQLSGIGSPSTASALLLPYGSSVQQLVNATFGLVLAPQGLAAAQTQSMRTSAVLQLEFQPMPNAAANAVSNLAQQAVAASLLPLGMLPQEAYQALLARGGDPWLHMAQQQASGQLPRDRQQHGGDGMCDHAGCQYQGRAECAQPFCAEMNSLWAASRASRA